MTTDELADHDPDLILMEPRETYDPCIVGLVQRAGSGLCVCYSINKIIAKLVEGGMSDEEAWEYLEYNIVDAYVGEHTPAFLYPFTVKGNGNA